ncbi:MAG: transcription elongation factor GreA [Candidatus Kerfeldbacteria bacterium]|nr:transcription elongation factor GreA [Candidatus Kerfeldbacteria bacterium]
MNERQTFITKNGLEKLGDELKQLKSVKRREIAQRIQEAKELGDLSENAEYVEAKNEQAFVEGRIAELDAIIKNAVIIHEEKNSELVRVGSKVKLKNDGETQTFEIVGSNEADPQNGRISNESPLGQALVGKRVGETIEVTAPKGKRTFRILAIT